MYNRSADINVLSDVYLFSNVGDLTAAIRAVHN